jgi:hypothetical protein
LCCFRSGLRHAVRVRRGRPRGAGEFGNYCAMGLVNGEKKLTDCSISQKIDKKTYCFGSNGAKESFMQDPEGNIAKAQENFSSGN